MHLALLLLGKAGYAGHLLALELIKAKSFLISAIFKIYIY